MKNPYLVILGCVFLLGTSLLIGQGIGGFGVGGTDSGGGGGSANTNEAVQAWSGTNTFNGPTIFNHKATFNHTNFIYQGTLSIGTNANTALLDSGYDLILDQRAGTAKGYSWLGVFGKSSQGAYLTVGGPTDANSVQIDSEGGVVGRVRSLGNITTFYIGNANAAGETTIFNGSTSIPRVRTKSIGTSIGPDGVYITNIVSGTIVADPPSLGTLASFTTNLAVTGARAGNGPVDVGSNYITNGIWYRGFCLTNGTIWIEIRNMTSGTIDAEAMTLRAIQTVVE